MMYVKWIIKPRVEVIILYTYIRCNVYYLVEYILFGHDWKVIKNYHRRFQINTLSDCN